MTPPRKDTGIFLHRLTPWLPLPKILALRPCRVSIVGTWDSIGRTRSWDAITGLGGQVSSRVSFLFHVTKLGGHFGSRMLRVSRFFWDRGRVGDVGVPRLVTWAECRKVASAYIRIYTRVRRGGARKATYACLVWDCEIVGWATTRYCSLFQRVRLELWLVSRERDTRAPRWQCIVWSIIIGHARVLIRRFNACMRQISYCEVMRCNMWLIQEHARVAWRHISSKEIRESTVAILDIACIPRGESID